MLPFITTASTRNLNRLTVTRAVRFCQRSQRSLHTALPRAVQRPAWSASQSAAIVLMSGIVVSMVGMPRENVALLDSMADHHSMLDLADEMYDHPQKYSRTELLDLMEKLYNIRPEDPEVLWRLARAIYEVSLAKGLPTEDKKALTLRAYGLVEKATTIEPRSFASQKWGGILLTAVGDFESTKVRIGNSYKIRDYFLTASKLHPTDPNAHHLLGRWSFAIANISWVERKAASLIFGTPPVATFEEALEQFLHAEHLEPNFWKKNLVMIGNCYLKMNKKAEAKEYFQRALKLNIVTDEDRESQEEAEQALKKL